MGALLEELKDRNLVIEELKDKLECYSLRRRQEYEASYRCVSLMLDAMTIKMHLQYFPQTQTMSGYVDMGDRLNEMDVASEAVVFMVVGLQGDWKSPIAYYLTAETQNALVEHVLEEQHHRQIRVVCMMTDDHASNVGMCIRLGCDLKSNPCEPLKTHFPFPVTLDSVCVN